MTVRLTLTCGHTRDWDTEHWASAAGIPRRKDGTFAALPCDLVPCNGRRRRILIAHHMGRAT